MKLAGCGVLFSPASGNEPVSPADWRNGSPPPGRPQPSVFHPSAVAVHAWTTPGIPVDTPAHVRWHVLGDCCRSEKLQVTSEDVQLDACA